MLNNSLALFAIWQTFLVCAGGIPTSAAGFPQQGPFRSPKLSLIRRVGAFMKASDFRFDRTLSAQRKGMGLEESGPEMSEQPVAGFSPQDIAALIANSPQSGSCVYQFSPHVVNEIIKVLTLYNSYLTQKSTKAQQTNSSPGGEEESQPPEGLTPPSWQKRRRSLWVQNRAAEISSRPAPTFYRYGAQARLFFPGRRLAGRSLSFKRCLPTEPTPVQAEAAPIEKEVTKDQLVLFKTDFLSLEKSFADLLTPLKLGVADDDPSGQPQLGEVVAMANNAIAAHEQIAEQITALGSETATFQLTKQETLNLWGLLVDYNNAKLSSNAMNPNFVDQDASLGTICSTFQTTFQQIDADLEGLLNLNDNLEELSREVAGLGGDGPAQTDAAALAISKLRQVGRNINSKLEQIQRSLETTDTLSKEAEDTLLQLKQLAKGKFEVAVQKQSGSIARSHCAGLMLGVLVLAFVTR